MQKEEVLEIGSLRQFLLDAMKRSMKPIISPKEALKDALSGDPYDLKRFKVVEEKKDAPSDHAPD